MNKKIEDLMYHAGLTAQGCWDEMDEYDRKAIETFAELIVKECAELCKKQEYDYWRASEDQDYTPIDCANAIEKHFGVEE